MTSTSEQVIEQVEAVLSKAEEVDLTIHAPDPLSTHVDLPVGLRTLRGRATSATVRELNGEDEEFIARTGTPAKSLQAILRRGTVSIGDEEATAELLDRLPAGDAVALLLKIRQVTFGDEIPLYGVICQKCGNEQEVILRISEDVPSDTYTGVDLLDLKLSAGRTVVTPATSGITHKIAEAIDAGKTQAEALTLLLYGCVQSIGGDPVVSESQIRQLSIRDRHKIVEELEKTSAGPRMDSVSINCGACEEVLGLPITMAQLFRL